MTQDGTIELFQYWDRLRAGRAAPKRTEIEPADIKRLLADTFILERDSRGEAVFRLAGTRLCATYGRELKGFSFAGLWAERDRAVAARLAANAFKDKCISVVTSLGRTAGGRQASFEMLLLPLDGGVDNPRCLGIVTPESRPYWLGAEAIVENRIDAVRPVDPENAPAFLRPRPSMAAPPLQPSQGNLSIRPPAGSVRRFRHLVVIDGGRDD